MHYAGYFFLNEIDAAPSLVGVARMVENTASNLFGVMGDFFRVRQICSFYIIVIHFFQSVAVSRSLLDTTSRKDDVVYTMPGP